MRHRKHITPETIQNATPILVEEAPYIKVVLLDGCWTKSAIRETSEGRKANFEDMEVDEDLQRKGIGTRLVQTTFKHFAAIGVDYVDSTIIDAQAMRNHGKIFGDALHFIENTPDGEVLLPLDIDQACASIERADAAWDTATKAEQDLMRMGIITRVCMTDVDTSTWETPVPQTY